MYTCSLFGFGDSTSRLVCYSLKLIFPIMKIFKSDHGQFYQQLLQKFVRDMATILYTNFRSDYINDITLPDKTLIYNDIRQT